MKKKALIIGAGPAGLTTAYELLTHTDIQPVIFEKSSQIGGISKTVVYKGNRIDIGGHRFYSKSEWVMKWWNHIMPVQGSPAIDYKLLKRKISLNKSPQAPDPDKSDTVMLVRHRLSRILYLKKFFDYPITLTIVTIKNLGIWRVIKISVSYLYAKLFPVKPETFLDDFFINHFGYELYKTFFKDYTEKVWGVPCSKIKAAWGAQRIKGSSITKAILHALKKKTNKADISQKETETSLIEQFMYPKFGPGQFWEEVARIIKDKGGEIVFNAEVSAVYTDKGKVQSVSLCNNEGMEEKFEGNYVFSTMPVKELISAMTNVPEEVSTVANGLVYRDFITVGLLLDKMLIKNNTRIPTINDTIPDNWIYIQEPDVNVGRIQIFNNWSPYLVSDTNFIWLGMEYFCNEGDKLWSMDEEDLKKYAIEELQKINFIHQDNVKDSVVIKVAKAYPAYFGSYDQFDIIKKFTDPIENLFLIGRNGMHRYNNMDHSMLVAKTAVSNIVNGVVTKDNLWHVNTEKEYHEDK
jgi:protoporphyrinogen oxidase